MFQSQGAQAGLNSARLISAAQCTTMSEAGGWRLPHTELERGAYTGETEQSLLCDSVHSPHGCPLIPPLQQTGR